MATLTKMTYREDAALPQPDKIVKAVQQMF